SAIVARDQGIEFADARQMYSALAHRLSPRGEGDALARAKEWLEEELTLSQQQSNAICSLLPKTLPRPVDWTTELSGLIEHAPYREPFIPISTAIGAALGEALNLPKGEKVCCLYPGSSTIAWGLARTRP